MHDFCLTIPYGVIIACGGIFGFLKAGSNASLIAGGGSGGLLLLLGYGGYFEYKKRGTVSKAWTFASLVVSSVIWVMMGKRVNKTGKLMPSAPVGALALGMSLFYVHKMTKSSVKPATADSGSGSDPTDKKET